MAGPLSSPWKRRIQTPGGARRVLALTSNCAVAYAAYAAAKGEFHPRVIRLLRDGPTISNSDESQNTSAEGS